MPPKRWGRAALTAGSFLALIAVSAAGEPGRGESASPPAFRIPALLPRFNLIRFPKARPSPDFSLPDLEGKTVRLSDLRGKVLVLSFWATGCRPCVAEMSGLERLHRRFRARPFEVIAVSVDTEGVERVRDFVKRWKFTFRVLHDRKKTTEGPFGLRGLPISYVIDAKGRMVAGAVGGEDWASEEAYAYFEGLLKKVSNP